MSTGGNRVHPETLVLIADLPFFPGKNGHDFFNLRYLAQRHSVGLVGLHHAFIPEAGVANLERFLTGSFLWPRPADDRPLPPLGVLPGGLAGWVQRLPAARRHHWLMRLLGLLQEPPDAYMQLSTLANCAPHFLAALAERSWQTLVLIQTNTAPWLDYLPAHLAKFVYFHDVRSDALRREAEHELDRAAAARRLFSIPSVAQQEKRICREAEVIGFVSALDEWLAIDAYHPEAETGVAPIPVDTDYYLPAPEGWRKDPRPIVLFTGHLSHPPNVDAINYFLESIWPLIRAQAPDAVFQAVGCLPTEELARACQVAGAELHADVPDIRPYFWNATAYVVPMRFGGGVRQKIFEAWLMRAPVVCTTMAVEGTHAEHGINCWMEDDPAAFAARLLALLRADEPGRERVVAAGELTARKFNSIPAAAGAFEKLVDRAATLKRRRPYRLLLDLRWMEIGKAGGVEQLAYEMVSAISGLDRQNEYRLLCPRSTYSEWNFAPDFRVRGIFTDKNESRAEALKAGICNRLAEGLQLPPVLTPQMRALKSYNRLDFDLVHSTCAYIHPDLECFPNVLTMLDLQHVHYPEFFSAEEWKVRDQLYRRASERARHITCISEFTRQDLHRVYGVSPEKTSTAWIIPSRAAWIKLEPRRAQALLAGIGLQEGRFLFYPAHPWPHKNHARLISALALISKELPPDVRLVFTGRNFEARHPARELIAAYGLENRVLHLGYRSALEIRALYGGALGLVFPSLFEGFGMPVAEAMISGCPVACSNATSLPEIAGDAAVLFDPLSEEAMARAMLQLATDATLRAKLVIAGTRRRGLFSARLSAVKMLAIYRQTFEGFYPG